MKIALLYDPSPEHLSALRAAAPGAELAVGFASLDDAVRAVRGADAVLGQFHAEEALAAVSQDSLAFVQTPSAGVEQVLPVLRNPRTVVCNGHGLYDEEVADHALALALGIVRGLGRARDQQREGRWARWPLPALADRPALVLGLGGVGMAISRRLAACGVRVRGFRARPSLGAPPGVAELVPDWRGALADTGLLLLALPLTEQTRNLVGARELATLPRGAVVVNVARGELIDEPALCAALESGHLGGAGLDVFAQEPLPSASQLWRLPSALITPHLGRVPAGAELRWQPLFAENLRRFARGEELLNQVDRVRGY